jgi:hypothetical protein
LFTKVYQPISKAYPLCSSMQLADIPVRLSSMADISVVIQKAVISDLFSTLIFSSQGIRGRGGGTYIPQEYCSFIILFILYRECFLGMPCLLPLVLKTGRRRWYDRYLKLCPRLCLFILPINYWMYSPVFNVSVDLHLVLTGPVPSTFLENLAVTLAAMYTSHSSCLLDIFRTELTRFFGHLLLMISYKKKDTTAW